MKQYFLISALIFLSFPALAIEFQLPLKCDIGKDCFVQNYVDETKDQAEDYKDYKCGMMTYPGHKGTDFRITTLEKMEQGVDVVAASDGVVLRVRDGVQDINMRKLDPKKIDKIGCGNAVIMQNAEGFQTSYCHMKKGSVLVKPGQNIKAGDKLGQVGLSGDTEFPHVHFEVRLNDHVIDPFTGIEAGYGCNVQSTLDRSLWQPPLRDKLRQLVDSAVLNAGFSTLEPAQEDSSLGKYDNAEVLPNSPSLYFWAEIMGIRKDDQLVLEIIAPDGKAILAHQSTFVKNKAVDFVYIGKRLATTVWLPGTYKGRVELLRKSGDGSSVQKVFAETREIKIAEPTVKDISTPAAKQ